MTDHQHQSISNTKADLIDVDISIRQQRDQEILKKWSAGGRKIKIRTSKEIKLKGFEAKEFTENYYN